MKKIFCILIVLIATGCRSAPNSIKYPYRAEILRIPGQVTAMYDINSKGGTENVRIIIARPPYIFEQEVTEQIIRWKFKEGEPKKDIVLNVKFQTE